MILNTLLTTALILFFWLIEYSYAMIIGTIAITETPDYQPEKESEKARPITDSLSAAVNHLRLHVGRWFWLRGIAAFLAHDMMSDAVLPAVLPAFFERNPFTQKVRSMVSAALLANWQVAWVHTIITKPSPKYFYQRLLQGWRSSIRVLPVILLDIAGRWLAFSTTIQLQQLFLAALGIPDIGLDFFQPDGSQIKQAVSHGYMVWAIGVIPKMMEWLISTPARIVFVRIVASTLDDDDEPIVPLDPILKSTYQMGIVNAWNSCTRASRGRIWRIQGRAFFAGAVILFSGKMVFSNFHEFVSLPPVWFNA